MSTLPTKAVYLLHVCQILLFLDPFCSGKRKMNTLNLRPLREQVYEFLRKEMQTGALLPGFTINLNKLSAQLGVSKTPLRDALIRLEAKGFVTILPRRGVKVNQLILQDIKNIYEILGSLEASVIVSGFHRFDQNKIDQMERINTRYSEAISAGDFERIYHSNLSFHNSFLELSDNTEMRRLIDPLKQRLYDFPRRSYLSEWELRNAREHQQFIDFIKNDDCESAVRIMRDVHWSYMYQEKFICRFYTLGVEEYRAEIASLRAERGAGVYMGKDKALTKAAKPLKNFMIKGE